MLRLLAAAYRILKYADIHVKQTKEEAVMDRSKVLKLQAAIGNIVASRKFTLARHGKDISLIKIIAKRPVTIFMRAVDEGFWIENPNRDDRCVNSFFEFCETPKRVTRNKDLLANVTMHLKETGMWEFIVNKDFFKINELNKKSNKKAVQGLFNSLRRG